MTTTPPPGEPPPDISADVERLAAARMSRIRRSTRLRAAHRLARLIGVDKRNAAKLARIRNERGEL